MRHQPAVEDRDRGYFLPVCSCGWRAGYASPGEEKARKRAEAHAAAKEACEKVTWPTEQEARQALLDAKIAKGLKRNSRRREQRAYWCPRCQGWHLTSRPAPRGPAAVLP
jgi:hypothetical protein